VVTWEREFIVGVSSRAKRNSICSVTDCTTSNTESIAELVPTRHSQTLPIRGISPCLDLIHPISDISCIYVHLLSVNNYPSSSPTPRSPRAKKKRKKKEKEIIPQAKSGRKIRDIWRVEGRDSERKIDGRREKKEEMVKLC